MKTKTKTLDIKVLREYESNGWLITGKHDTLPLIIWNYSQQTQYEGHWDEITLMCRGLVTDHYGNIISRGFSKFFNYEERHFEISPDISDASVYEKLDGSFIMIFYYIDQWILCSKGSFHSPQSDMGKSICVRMFDTLEHLPKELSYCFELIHPDNQIVVNYGGDVRLVYLSSFYPNGEENNKSELFSDIVHEYTVDSFDYEKLKNNQIENAEGYVCVLPNGDRFKIKFENYKRLHSIVTNATTYTVFDSVSKTGDVGEILENIPDEMYMWVKETKHSILKDFFNWKSEVYSEYARLMEFGIKTDKEFAELVKNEITNKKIIGHVFSLRKYDPSRTIYMDKDIFSRIKPPFKKAFR